MASAVITRPADPRIFSASLELSCSRPSATTLAPAVTNALLAERPMPLVPPITTIALFSSAPGIVRIYRARAGGGNLIVHAPLHLLNRPYLLCSSDGKNPSSRGHERRSRFLGSGRPFAGAGLRRGRDYAEALAAGLCFAGGRQVLRPTGGHGCAQRLAQAGHSLLPRR